MVEKDQIKGEQNNSRRAPILTLIFGCLLIGGSIWSYYANPELALFAVESMKQNGTSSQYRVGSGWSFVVGLLYVAAALCGGFRRDDDG